MMPMKRFKKSFPVIALLTILTGAAGCGRSGPKTHPVTGTITLDGADVSQLAGHSVEGVLETDPAVRASGVIQKDGRFKLVSLLEGEMREGAAPGKYNARIVVSDDVDDHGKKPGWPPLAKRFLRIETSGLSFVVSETSEVQLALSARAR
ncbi:hypothetical protein [Zavarzinella formosa]|uniref:hypothetical protein n=1 Tax=Zavarzinella formosa TaxID=360055 RepID=UPI0002E7AF58|nr:hypothetical protein [Zavarzinella formosa]